MVDELTIRHVCVPQMYDGVVSLSNAKVIFASTKKMKQKIHIHLSTTPKRQFQ